MYFFNSIIFNKDIVIRVETSAYSYWGCHITTWAKCLAVLEINLRCKKYYEWECTISHVTMKLIHEIEVDFNHEAEERKGIVIVENRISFKQNWSQWIQRSSILFFHIFMIFQIILLRSVQMTLMTEISIILNCPLRPFT